MEDLITVHMTRSQLEKVEHCEKYCRGCLNCQMYRRDMTMRKDKRKCYWSPDSSVLKALKHASENALNVKIVTR